MVYQSMEDALLQHIIHDNLAHLMVLVPESNSHFLMDANYTGAFKKKVLLLFSLEDCSEEHAKSHLEKIIAASAMTLDDFRIVPMERSNSKPLLSYIRHFNPSAIFVFGASPALMHWYIDLPINCIASYESTKVIYTDNLTTIMADRNAKLNFWKIWTQQLEIQPKKS